MYRVLLLAAVCLAASPASAAELGAAEFDALTRGRTVIYTFGGDFHGMERHFGDRRVEWAFSDGECFTGRWYEAAGNICFVYEGLEGPQCWRFADAPGGFLATFMDGANPGETYVARFTDAPMTCTGPRVGS